jgi:hypothetical protein
MKIVDITLESVSPYSQSKKYYVEKFDRELPKDYETRTWRERQHYDSEGRVFIPPMAIKNCLAEAAKFLSIQIPGKGKATYTKHFEAGTLVTEPLLLVAPSGKFVHKDEVEGQWLFVDSGGKRGGSNRVDRCFPVVPQWTASGQVIVLDEIITEDVMKEHLEKAGAFIGIGRFRPRNNGFYGRFKVARMDWPKS